MASSSTSPSLSTTSAPDTGRPTSPAGRDCVRAVAPRWREGHPRPNRRVVQEASTPGCARPITNRWWQRQGRLPAEPGLTRPYDRLGPAGHVELGEDAGHVVPDRL